MSGFGATQSTGIEVSAMVYPACAVCGKAYNPTHIPAGCTGYVPSGPVRDLGTRAKSYPSGMPLLRRLACEAIWAVERRVKVLRERIERS